MKLRSYKNIILVGDISVFGKPIIDISDDCNLIIGDNVTLNSKNNGYHINMHSPVKLMADMPGAYIHIGKNTRINGSCIHAYLSITIGDNCLIAANCQIFDCSGHDLSFDDVSNRINTCGFAKCIKIENNVWIGANSIILPGVTIFEGAVIQANSVVRENVPPMSLVGGNPAAVIKRYPVQ